MATVLRQPLITQVWRKPPSAPDLVPNNLAALYRLQIAAPFRQSEWLVPQRNPVVQSFEWSGVTTRGIPNPPPFGQDLWPDPFGARRLPQDHIQAGYPAPSITVPFSQDDWPSPTRTAGIDYLAFSTTVYLPGPVRQPFVPPDLPTPMRAKATPQDFFFPSTSIPPPKPFAQNDWQRFERARALLQDFQISGVTTRGIPSGINAPFNFDDWPLPLRARWTFHDVPPNILALGIKQPLPFNQSDWPLPMRPKLVPGESHGEPLTLRTAVYLKPFAQYDWVTPQRAREVRPDWVWDGHGSRLNPNPPAGYYVFPNLVGLNYYEAQLLLTQLGIYQPVPVYAFVPDKLSASFVQTELAPPGIIIAQNPVYGSIVRRGVYIHLTIAEFPTGLGFP